jgi:nicotinamidase-related amidase
MSGSVHELPFGEERLKVVDMQRDMVEEAFRVAEEALASHEIEREIAKHIKQHFDAKY